MNFRRPSSFVNTSLYFNSVFILHKYPAYYFLSPFSSSVLFASLSPIPFKYVYDKNKPINLYFNIYDLDDINKFSFVINNNIDKDIIHTVFIKIRYNLDSFFMLGNQFGFTLHSNNDIFDLLFVIKNRLEEYFQEYNISNEDIVYLQVSFRRLNIKLFSEFKLDKLPHIPNSDILDIKNNLKIPIIK